MATLPNDLLYYLATHLSHSQDPVLQLALRPLHNIFFTRIGLTKNLISDEEWRLFINYCILEKQFDLLQWTDTSTHKKANIYPALIILVNHKQASTLQWLTHSSHLHFWKIYSNLWYRLMNQSIRLKDLPTFSVILNMLPGTYTERRTLIALRCIEYDFLEGFKTVSRKIKEEGVEVLSTCYEFIGDVLCGGYPSTLSNDFLEYLIKKVPLPNSTCNSLVLINKYSNSLYCGYNQLLKLL